ncbi:hypothetical protein FD31_GL002205 [Companilactobacillus nantensis DSM 16982]|uniref:Peptidase M56 domain-containing protein n=2 Tax=Companilactobacillus nantensis TaxID=305793 RepID=A0A0R1W880_9LACO|nr:hypothetical protein FD31_GL002205 [Companilactobacillus nantensis DSM 16982]
MRISISSIIVSLLLTLILICFLQLILKSKKLSQLIRTDFLLILSLPIFLRLILPVEFSNTRTIRSTVILPSLYKMGKKSFVVLSLFKIDIFQILILIWLVGIFVRLLFLSYNFFKVKKSLNSLFSSSKITKEIRLNDNGDRFTICKFNFNHSPFVAGIIKPKIFLPNYISNKDIERIILNHEIQHIKNNDLIKKLLLEFIECIYWWFIPIYTFKKQANLIIEMSVDQKVTENMNSNDYFQYVESLVSVSKAVNSKESVTKFNESGLVSNFTLSESSSLVNRIKFLLNEYDYKHTSKYILALVLLLPLLLTSTIFEPYYASPKKVVSTSSIKKSGNDYILKRGNHYYLIIDGNNSGEVSNLKDQSIRGLPIKNGE